MITRPGSRDAGNATMNRRKCCLPLARQIRNCVSACFSGLTIELSFRLLSRLLWRTWRNAVDGPAMVQQFWLFICSSFYKLLPYINYRIRIEIYVVWGHAPDNCFGRRAVFKRPVNDQPFRALMVVLSILACKRSPHWDDWGVVPPPRFLFL